VATQQVPEPWASRMIERGLVQRDGRANISALARKAQVAVETARRVLNGTGTPDPETVLRLAEVLGMDIQEWVGQKVDLGPYDPPDEAVLLDHQ